MSKIISVNSLHNLPKEMSDLIVEWNIYHKLENIPDNLHTLQLDYSFNQRLDVLPPDLFTINILDKHSNIDSLHDKYMLDMIDSIYELIINIKGRKGMFTKSSNKF